MRRINRTFSSSLQDYCFGSSFAAGWDEDFSSVDVQLPVAEYASLPKQAKPLPAPAADEGSSSCLATVVNITKSLVGIGMLTLPRALADGTPLVGVGILSLCGSLSALSFFMLGYCAHLTSSKSLPQLWDATVGPGSAFLVEIVIVFDTLLSCIAFALLIGDYTSKSLAGLFPGLPESLRSHGTLTLAFGTAVLLPLCMVRRLSLLRFSSAAGLACTLYVFLYVVCDFAFADGPSPADLQSGGYKLRPASLLRSTAIFSVAFMSHSNAPAFFADLRGRSPSRFAAVSAAAFGAALLLYATFGLSGLGRFGQAVPGNALAAYELTTAVLLMWLGMGLCVTASFPLVFAALRSSVLRLAARAQGRTESADGRGATVVLVLAIACAGAVLDDLSAVVSLCGAVSGVCLSLVFPGAIMLGVRRRKTPQFKALARAFVGLGLWLGLASTAAVVCRDVLAL